MVKALQIGAASELIVAADLLRQGFEVFRAVAYTASCDLVFGTPAGRMWRVQVKTAHPKLKRNGEPRGGRIWHSERCDVLAYVLRDGTTVYQPSLAELECE